MPALRHEEEAVQAKERQANGKGTGEEEGRGAGNNVKIQKLKPRFRKKNEAGNQLQRPDWEQLP